MRSVVSPAAGGDHRRVTPAPRPLQLPPGALVRVRALAGGGGELVCQVLGPLGHGTHSQTWLARAGERHVALKGPRWCEPGRFQADLEVEERILGQLRSEGLIQLLGAGEGPEGTRLLCYERAFPNPLLVLSRPEVRRCFPDPGTRFVPLPVQVTLSLGRDLLRGLEDLHAHGFVHHDVKLENLLVRLPEPGEVVPLHRQLEHALGGRARGVLVDLGASRSVAYLQELNAGTAAADVQLVPPQLTPLYAPPEALLPRGPRPLLHPSLDVYAAGVVVYACATGRLPYEDQGLDTEGWSGLLGTKALEREGRVVPLSFQALAGAAGYRSVADELYRLLLSCLHRDPARRPSPRAARGALERLLEGLPAAVRIRRRG